MATKTPFQRPDLAKAFEVIARGESEEPAALLDSAPPAATEAATLPATAPVASVNTDYVSEGVDDPLVPFTLRLPKSLSDFYLDLAAKQTQQARKRVTPSALYVRALTEDAKAKGYEPPK